MSERFHKELVRGSLDVLVLSALAEQPKYGYLIQKHVRDSTAGHAALTAGTLYPLLHRLEAQKLVRSYWDESTGRKRKWYSLTAAGRKRLTSDARQLQTFAESMLRLLGGVLKKNPPEPA
jgi:DNA-binding PadR family transcriptional regulator